MFLDYFMPRKVVAGNETMKAAGTVIKKLRKWLVARGYVPAEEVEEDSVEELARNLPASQELLDLLDGFTQDNPTEDCDEEVEGHFWIKRIEPGQIWLEPVLEGSVLGPFVLPETITRQCKVGWDIGGAVALTAQGWQFVEVWNLSP